MSTNTELAIQTANSIELPYYRIHFLSEVALKLPVDQGSLILEQTIPLLDGIQEPRFRVESLTALASGFYELGNIQQANELYTEALELAPKLRDGDRARFSRGGLAWHMAPLDYEASMQLLKQNPSKPIGDRYLGNVAHQIADVVPPEAENLLKQIKDERKRDDIAVRVAYRMASTDPARAERIVRGIGGNLQRAYGLGLIAPRLSNVTNDGRIALLEEAWQILQSEADSGRRGRTTYTPVTIAVGLLPTVEQIMPDRLHEFFWQALSMRGDFTAGNEGRLVGRHGPQNTMRLADPVLGAAIARYDATTAKRLTMTPGDETLDLGFSDAPYFFFGALTVLEPETAIRAVASMSTSNDQEIESKLKAWKQVLSMLNKTTEQRWEYVIEDQYHLWRPDDVD